MIAPLQPGNSRKLVALGGLASARRALAAALWQPAVDARPRHRVSQRRAWALAGWTVAVAIAYLALGQRWRVPWY